MKEANLTSLFYRILFAMASQPICEKEHSPLATSVRQHMSNLTEHAFARLRTGLLSYEGFLSTLAMCFGMFIAGKAQNVPGRQWATYSDVEKDRLSIDRYVSISCEYIARLAVGLAGVQTPMLVLRRVTAILKVLAAIIEEDFTLAQRDILADISYHCGWDVDQLLNEVLAVNNIYATTLRPEYAAAALVAAGSFVDRAQRR